jgi:hypothetical protein
MGPNPAPDPRPAAEATAIERLFDGAADPALSDADASSVPGPADDADD